MSEEAKQGAVPQVVRQWSMTLVQALPILMDMASRYGENEEEAFPKRVDANMGDGELSELAEQSLEFDIDEITEIRDLWRACEIGREYVDANPDVADMDVFSYFSQTLDEDNNREREWTFMISSPCGQDCKRAIDGARAMLDAVKNDSAVRDAIVDACAHAIDLLIFG